MKNNLTERIQRYVEQLSVKIGSRPVGSQNNLQAQRFIALQLQEAGLTVETPRIDSLDWAVKEVELICAGRSLEVVANPFTPSCEMNEEFVVVKSLEELKAKSFAGKVVVLTGELSAEPIIPKNFTFYNPEEHQRVNRRLEEENPKAVIMVSHSEQVVPLIEDGDFTLPSVTVPKSVGEFITQQRGALINLAIDTILKPATSIYPIGRIDNGCEKKIVICAHTDTKHYTKGAIDNATGTAALMALAGELKDVTDVDIEFIGFNGEDYYSTPSQLHYLANFAQDLDRIKLLINIDSVGVSGDKNSIAFFECDDRLLENMREATAHNPLIEEAEPWPMGDHMIFAMSGVPCVAFTSQSIMGLIDSVVHTQKDTIDLVDPKSVAQTVEFIKDVVKNL